MKTLINVSGGAIKFISLISSFKRLLEKGVDPSVVSGCSSGAIVCLLYVCGKIDEGLVIARKTSDISIIYSKKNSPLGKIAGFSLRALIRLVMG